MDSTKWLNNILDDTNKTICILGDTVSSEKFAYRIKQAFITKGFKNIFCVDKELDSLSKVPSEVDLLVLCMNPLKEIKLLSEATNNFKNVLIQPGAGSDDIEKLLNTKNIEYFNGCILKHWNLI